MNRFIFSNTKCVISFYCPMNCRMYFWLYITNIINLGDFVSKPQCINADVQGINLCWTQNIPFDHIEHFTCNVSVEDPLDRLRRTEAEFNAVVSTGSAYLGHPSPKTYYRTSQIDPKSFWHRCITCKLA